MLFKNLKCIEDCIKKDKNCTDHKVKCLQYERAEYHCKGEIKKKIQLVDKLVTLPQLMELLEARLRDFPRHCFNIAHTILYGKLYMFVATLDTEPVHCLSSCSIAKG